MKITDILYSSNTINNLDIANKQDLLVFISEALSKILTDVDEKQILALLQKREQLGNTAIGCGVAIPHAKFTNVSTPIGVFIKLKKPIDYGVENEPVDLVFGLLIPEVDSNQYLEILALLAEKFSNEDFCDKLRNAKTDEELYKFITS